uniref:Uncharacterized protein n=1 Tax=Podoviridae sp. ctaNW81 TaxID=2826562 RepID=A0A8S5M620_9CAUD|nr:MAG TPA: hypothetical protein [Podoviridae sp. ctaNW81]
MSNLLQQLVPDITDRQERNAKQYRHFDENGRLTLCLRRHDTTGEWIDVTVAERARLGAIEIQLEIQRAETRAKEQERLDAYRAEHPEEFEEDEL